MERSTKFDKNWEFPNVTGSAKGINFYQLSKPPERSCQVEDDRNGDVHLHIKSGLLMGPACFPGPYRLVSTGSEPKLFPEIGQNSDHQNPSYILGPQSELVLPVNRTFITF
jgi:hypothetical protein